MEMTEAVKAKIETINGNIQKIVTELQPRIKSLEESGQGVAELKAEVNKMVEENSKLHAEIKSLNDRADGIETAAKEARHGYRVKSIGQEIEEALKDVENVAGKSWTADLSQDITQAVKTVTTITDAAGSAGPLHVPQFRPGIIAPGMRRLTIRDLLMGGTTSAPAYVFMQEKEQTGGADYQLTQGAEKATTGFVFEDVTKVVATIAHTGKVALQTLDDVSGLSSYIQGRMVQILEQKFEDEILDGTGTGARIHGINAQADAFDPSLKSDLNASGSHLLDTIGTALYQVSLAHAIANGIVVNPREGWAMRMMKRDSNGDGGYLFGDPGNSSPNLRPWGVPMVETFGQTAGDFTVGAFGSEAQLLMRQGTTVRVSTENEDDFNRNLASVRAELRAVLAVYRPSAFVHGAFSAT